MNINPFDIIKNAQKIQEQMSGFQEKLETISVTGASGGSMVEVDLNGKFDVMAVRLSPQAMECDAEMLQDLIMAAFSDGMAKVKDSISGQFGAMTGGMNIPGFPGAGFPGAL